MKIGKRFKRICLPVIMAATVSLLGISAGTAAAATLQPTINPAGGTYNLAQTVVINNIANGDTAYYTTDGSNPENSSTRTVYSGAIQPSTSRRQFKRSVMTRNRLEQCDLGLL